jgi:biopolymer transport protein ExbB/TolQ
MSFNPIELWGKMTIIAQGVVVVLIVMSIYSLTIAFERFLYYRKARNQSVAYAKMVTGFLKQDKLQDAIDASKKFKNSHVARVLSAGLYEFSHDIKSGGANMKGHDMIEAAERAIEREALVTTADMKKGLSGLATIGTTAPFIGLFGTVIGIINAFRGLALTGSRPLRGHSGRVDVQHLHEQHRTLPGRDVQLLERAHRLLHQAARRWRAAERIGADP